MVKVVRHKYKICFCTKFYKVPLLGVCEDNNGIYVFEKYNNLYRIYLPSEDFILKTIDNYYNLESNNLILRKDCQVDLIVKEDLIL